MTALGSKAAGTVMQMLSQDEVQRLCTQIANNKGIDSSLQDQVLE
jgi:flagellar motor switch protein FliG